TINRWQMRDRDYQKARPSGVYRIALLGSSMEFGSGVADNETFENLLEDRLNSESSAHGANRYEILNFAQPGHSALQYLALLERRVLEFNPQAVWLVVSSADLKRSIEHAATVLQSGYAIPYEILNNVAGQAGIEPSMSQALMRARLKPYGHDLV